MEFLKRRKRGHARNPRSNQGRRHWLTGDGIMEHSQVYYNLMWMVLSGIAIIALTLIVKAIDEGDDHGN